MSNVSEMFKHSVMRAVSAHAGLAPLVPSLMKLQNRADAQSPHEVLILTSVEVHRDIERDVEQVRAQVLALRGFGVEPARTIVEMLRRFDPDLSPDSMRLMPQSMLEEKFGNAIGETLAHLLVHPEDNPILHAMLFERPDIDTMVGIVRRSALRGTFTGAYHHLEQSLSIGPFVVNLQLRDWEPLPDNVANHAYQKAGFSGSLPLVVSFSHLENPLYASRNEKAPG